MPPPDWPTATPAVRELPADVSPSAFWRAAVAARQPVLVRGPPPDGRLPAVSTWTADYLATTAGDVPVTVETRRNADSRFGTGAPKRSLPFGKFIRTAAAGDATLYLSADAPPPAGVHGAPCPLGPLALALARDFPVRHPLAGRLILQALHVWIGHAPSGACSGLHHDYHDNVYAVISGRKRVTLFPPARARELGTVGDIATIHANGRIVYRGAGDVGADGALEDDVVALLGGGDESDDPGESGDAAADATDSDADLDAALAAAAAGDDVVDDYGDESDEGESDDASPPPPTTDPPSFTRLQLPADAARLPMAASATVDVGPGDTLFIPAGWFHSVVSESDGGGADPNLHAAISWWLHPPDAPGNEEAPYTRPYWSRVWEDVVAACPELREVLARQESSVEKGERATKRARLEE